ncbi:hypothetical protein IGI04_026566 [Brassica rapa subsp. trilocularis]|uniref:Uncharacterized protein n=1 Tax=Brassica rapa subsp. trilocularis TaxID=1813537 RepID=A0ABQ7KWN1_BRACM|nr:hypothetical protein IGI04_026566 [Brassica rapa subsp. trilocularis]
MITIDFLVTFVSFVTEIVSFFGSGRRICQCCRIWPENSSASSDLARELVSVVGSGRRTRQSRPIWPENSSASSSSDLAGELVVAGFDDIKVESEKSWRRMRIVLRLII